MCCFGVNVLKSYHTQQAAHKQHTKDTAILTYESLRRISYCLVNCDISLIPKLGSTNSSDEHVHLLYLKQSTLVKITFDVLRI